MRLLCVFGLMTLARVASAQPDPQDPPKEGGDPQPTPAPVPPPIEPTPAPAVVPPPVVVDPPRPEQPPPPPQQRLDLGFRFGSYGRVLAGSDLRGGKPQPATIVAHGPRIVEASYLELDFSYGVQAPNGMRVRPVITLAFDGTLFHDTGNFDAQPALRNMYLDAQVRKHLTAWVGSRMYRGDDIYLFDYWPLDDQNTVGGGLVFRMPLTAERSGRSDVIELAGHAGFNRLKEPSEFQFQTDDVPDLDGLGARTIVQLDRQRTVVSGTATYLMLDRPEAPNFKVKVHGEVHSLSSGTRRRQTDDTLEELPADTGFLIGAQIGTWGYAPLKLNYRRHLNLFARYARGLAAFDELAPPTTFGNDLKTNDASELSFGASGNWDHPLGNVMLGALSRRFIDADRNDVDFDDGWEYALDVRPLAKLGGGLFAGADISFQARFPRGLNPGTLRADDPAVFQIAPMIVYSPMGGSGYDRPQIRLVYRAAHYNQGARELFVPEDVRSRREWTYFLGVQCEWWFNSTGYNR
jgi:hypothetical protein